MNSLDNAQMARLIEKLAQDVWHKRSYLLPDWKHAMHLSYRVSITDYGDDPDTDYDDLVDVNVYFHVVITKERWFYLITETPEYDVTLADIMRLERDYRGTDEDDRKVRGESYRHYLFSSCFGPMVRARLDEISGSMVKPSDPFLWNTFPCVQIASIAEE